MMLLFVAFIHIPKALEGDLVQFITIFFDPGMGSAAWLYASTFTTDLRGLSHLVTPDSNKVG